MNDGMSMGVLSDGVYSSALQCHWLRWRVVGPRALAVDVPAGDCVDMTGAIRVAKALMPNVAVIHTLCGGEVDTMYSRVGKEWRAVRA